MSDATFMLGRPVVLNEFEEISARNAGVDLSVPYDNSVKMSCQGMCDREVWLGPLQQHKRRELGAENVEVLCPTCLTYLMEQVGAEVSVQNLGNTHPSNLR